MVHFDLPFPLSEILYKPILPLVSLSLRNPNWFWFNTEPNVVLNWMQSRPLSLFDIVWLHMGCVIYVILLLHRYYSRIGIENLWTLFLLILLVKLQCHLFLILFFFLSRTECRTVSNSLIVIVWVLSSISIVLSVWIMQVL